MLLSNPVNDYLKVFINVMALHVSIHGALYAGKLFPDNLTLDLVTSALCVLLMCGVIWLTNIGQKESFFLNLHGIIVAPILTLLAIYLTMSVY